MQVFLQTIVGGLSFGALYALIAIGFSLVYRTMGLVNFAQGDIAMVGAFIAATFYVSASLPFVASVSLAIIITGVVGVVIERVLRPLENRDFTLMLIGTIGFGIVLQSIAIIIWGATGTAMPTPTGSWSVNVFGIYLGGYQIVVIAVTAVTAALLQVFLKRSKSGIAMQAVALDYEAAYSVGINVGRSNAIAFVIGAGLAALGGALAGPVLYVESHLGINLAIKAFVAAALGGFGNINGALIGGVAFGLLDAFAGSLFAGYSQVVAFVVFAALIVVWPTGILRESRMDRA